MSKRNKSLMQSEIFIIIMIIIVMLYGITTIYAIKLEEENKKLKEILVNPDYIKKIEEENKALKKENERLKKENEELKKDNQALKKENERLKKENEELKERNRQLDEELKNNKTPPLITLSEDKKDFRFGVGKAKITDQYKNALKDKTLPELIQSIDEYDCDTVEVYGFTDTQPYNKKDNIDNKLHNCIVSECSIDKINIHSNLELGMKRAISIVYFLREQQKRGLIREDVIIKPYSAGQFIDEKGEISVTNKSDNKKRRRIEIRLSRSKKVNENNDSK